MAWPLTPLTTYFPNGVPAIKAADLNAFQTMINRLWANQVGRNINVVDHFTGSAVNTGTWTVNPASGGIVIIADDSGAGANGAVEMVSGSLASSVSSLRTSNLIVGTNDFWVSGRFRITTFAGGGGASSNFIFGFANAGADGNSCYVRVNNASSGTGGTNACIGLTYSSSPTVDTPVISTVTGTDGAYHTFDLVRSSGTLQTFIDSVLFDTRAFTQSIALTALVARCSSNTTTACTCFIDRLSCWFPE